MGENNGNRLSTPYEAQSLLLTVTHGCSHNKCTFCSMYQDIPFSICTLEKIKEELIQLSKLYPNASRIFLEHGDPFVLSADKLIYIAHLIHDIIPTVETIGMYASIQNIKSKSDEELKKLSECGITGLDIGVESGLDEALTYMKKGHTSHDARIQLKRLTQAGMKYSFNIILGSAGAKLWRENAYETARLINDVQPDLLFIGTMHADNHCQLYHDMKSGVFEECTFGQLLDEHEYLLELLELKDTYYFGSHPSNIVPMQGKLPIHQSEMIQAIKDTRERLKEKLDTYPIRGSEGSIVNL